MTKTYNYNILKLSKCELFATESKRGNMKRLIAILILLIMLVACAPSKEADIITTMHVQYDISKHIVRDKMTVSLLTPPGAEVHGYQPSSRDIEAIKKAKLFIYTSSVIDAWIKDPTALVGEDTIVMDMSEAYTLMPHENGSTNATLGTILPLVDEHEHDDEIHYWTDATTVMQLVNAIADDIIMIDPLNEEFYRNNANNYIREIEVVHQEMEEYFYNLEAKVQIYFAGHNALSAFAERYHIEIIALQDSYQPDADVTSVQIQAMIEEIKAANTHYLFIEELKEPKVANTIKSELAKENYDLKLLELHGYHNISKSQLDHRITYVDLMKQNFNNLKEALNGSI